MKKHLKIAKNHIGLEHLSSKKEYDRGFISHIDELSLRQHQDHSIIANNRSYVSRASRMTMGQLQAFNHAMRQFGIEYDNTHTLSQVCNKKSQKKYHEYESIILDIGFGAGHNLSQMAKDRPNELFIGIETFKPGIGALFVQTLPQHIQNIRCMHGDAILCMFHMIERSSIDRIQIFFPDPWQKVKHKKRRLVQTRFLQLCLHLLKEHGVLWIVSDWEDYAQHISHTLNKFSKEQINTYISQDYCFSQDVTLQKELESIRNISRFEKKGLEKGHKIYPFVYKKIRTNR